MTCSQQFILFELPQHINEPLYDITAVSILGAPSILLYMYILHILLHYSILHVLHILILLHYSILHVLHILLHYFILNVLHVLLHVLLHINVTELPISTV